MCLINFFVFFRKVELILNKERDIFRKLIYDLNVWNLVILLFMLILNFVSIL